MGTLKSLVQLTLWLRLLRQGMPGKALHFYGLVWVVAGSVLAASIFMVSRRSPDFPGWLLALGCLAVVVGFYCYTKVPGSLAGDCVAVLLAAWYLAQSGHGGFAPAFMAQAGALFTGILLFTIFVYSIASLPYRIWGYAGWPHRRAMALILAVTGAVELGLLHIGSNLPPGWSPVSAPPPGVCEAPGCQAVYAAGAALGGALRKLFTQPGWPLAICLWLWMKTGLLLSNYDAEILPPLLRRIGARFAPAQLQPEDAYMVDHLLQALPNRPDL